MRLVDLARTGRLIALRALARQRAEDDSDAVPRLTGLEARRLMADRL